MSWRSVALWRRWLRGFALVTGIGLAVAATRVTGVPAQLSRAAAATQVRLPDEVPGVDAIVRVLMSSFDHADVVALGEVHGRKADSDLRVALVRHPDFARRVRAVVVEFGSVTEQSILDRYINGEDIPMSQLERVWRTTTQFNFRPAGEPIDGQFYIALFSAVREVNSKLPVDARIRVFGGDPGPGDHRSREATAVSVLKDEVLRKHGKALVVYGAAHFYRALPADYLSTMGGDTGIVRMLDIDYPGRTFVVIPVGGRVELPPGVTPDVVPDYRKFDRTLKTQARPVLVSLQRLPFRNFTVEEFLGRTVLTCQGAGGCRSVFKGSTLTLGQTADAAVYFGAQ